MSIGKLAIAALTLLTVMSVASPVLAETSGQIVVDVDSRFASQIATIDDPSEKGALRITKDGITVDLDGYKLRSTETDMSKMVGIGIYAKGLKDVTIRGGIIAGYKWGIYLEDCENVVIEGTVIESSRMQHNVSTEQNYDTSDWLNQWSIKGFEQYGGAVYLKNSANCTVRGVTAEFQQNGVQLVDSRSITIEDCQLSFQSGWGIHLWNGDNCKIRRNVAEFCQRLEFWQYSAGGDSAGILIANDSCFNIIEDNSFAHGGDAFFLTGQRPWLKPSNFNIVRRNDCRFSPHNGIEATFSRGNRFIENDVSHSRYGFWLGYSYETIVEGNNIDGCIEDGIAIEHGHANEIIGNAISDCRAGIRIWQRPMPDWIGNDPSYEYRVTGNVLKDMRNGMIIEDTENVYISGNAMMACKEQVIITRCAAVDVSGNAIQGGRFAVKIEESKSVSVTGNGIMDIDNPVIADDESEVREEGNEAV